MRISGNSVGIDYHTSSLQVCIMNEEGKLLMNRRVSNDVDKVRSIVDVHGVVSSVVAEACNGSSNFLDELREKTGWKVKLCHPGYVSRMKHNPDKSDKSDGELLSDLNRVGYIPEVWLAPAWIRDLRSLVRYRQQQVDRMKKVKVRIRAILRQHRVEYPKEFGLWTIRGLNWLQNLSGLGEHTDWIIGRHLTEMQFANSELRVCHKRLLLIAKDDSVTQRLMEEKGVGIVTASVMRAEIGWFSRFRTGKQLGKYCGVSPRNNSSAEYQKTLGLIRAGNPLLKTAIIECAHRIARYDERWSTFIGNLKQQGKAYPLIIAAVANRWLRKMFHVMKEFETTQPQIIFA